jgi:VacB/RNase II family 3'-5' exoribonuclease
MIFGDDQLKSRAKRRAARSTRQTAGLAQNFRGAPWPPQTLRAADARSSRLVLQHRVAYRVSMSRTHEPGRVRLKRIAHSAMVERGLLPDFSPAVRAQADTIVRAAADSDSAIRDLRSLVWASIDNDDSRDLDQLSVALPSAGGLTTILVAVADVDALVAKGCAIDGHAQSNTTSVYTAAEIFPMLPEKLSTDLTSLGEGQERIALIVELTVNSEGLVQGSEVYRGLVLNHAKLAYDSVAGWLDGNAPAPARVAAVPGLEQQLRTQDSVAQRMKNLRHQHGALSLETIEARAVFDGDALSDLRAEKRNRAKDLIEDFMIGANGVTTRFLGRQGFPTLRRVLRSPERWERIVELALALGESLPAEADAPALEQFLAKRQRADPTSFSDVSLSVIKLLGRGEYVFEPAGRGTTGHFGLAVKDYSHSTAPNRRYPDLITQRLLKAALAGRAVPYRNDELDALARHCTQQEDNATKVERAVRKSAAALLLERRIGEHFDAIVTGASSQGTWVRIRQPAVEGKLVSGHAQLDVGDQIRVALVATDVERGFVDFARA